MIWKKTFIICKCIHLSLTAAMCFNMVFLSMCEHEIACLHTCVSALITNVLLEVLNKRQRGSLWLYPAVMTECQAEEPVTPISCSSQEGLFLWVEIHIHGCCSGSVAWNMPLWLQLTCNNFIFVFFTLSLQSVYGMLVQMYLYKCTVL